MLFDPRAHEPLRAAAWDPAAAAAAIGDIARDADAALRDDVWWPWHPCDLEAGDPDVVHGVYLGAAGVLWALDRLVRAGLHDGRHDYGRLGVAALEGYRARPEFDGPLPSLWMGEGGIALVAWLLAPEPGLADRLAEVVTTAPADDTLELMWGSPGLLLIATTMLERTGEERWARASAALADRLMARCGERVPNLWTQRLYGSTKEILGPAHGFAGVVAALARHPGLVPDARLVELATGALEGPAVRDGGLVNWPPVPGDALQGEAGIRTQWCHGAPGIVASLAALPADDELDALLLAGGELTWAAGPLRKGAGLCHGTAGNGLALLALFGRTGDELWLGRARSFAMHAAAQVAAARQRYGQGRYTLMTGDVGVAVYLQQCLAGTPGAPAVDLW